MHDEPAVKKMRSITTSDGYEIEIEGSPNLQQLHSPGRFDFVSKRNFAMVNILYIIVKYCWIEKNALKIGPINNLS